MKKNLMDSGGVNVHLFSELISALKEQHPLIHCITNSISINQCANAVLAVGGRPIMAEHPLEVAGITSTASSLMLNLGNITDIRMESMKIAAETASLSGIPVVLDAVGVACSKLRRSFALDLIKSFKPSVIKGNYSEILALTDPDYLSKGVDSETGLNFDTAMNAALNLSLSYGGVVLASGKNDIVTDGKSVILIKNGSPMLSEITGTGCMLGALAACFLAAAIPAYEKKSAEKNKACLSKNPGEIRNDSPTFSKLSEASRSMLAAVLSCVYLGICGELAETDRGNGSFSVNLFDRLSTLDMDSITKYMDTEAVKI